MAALTGRVAVVVGASRGIGAATSRALSEAGATVVLAARDEQRLTALADELSAAGCKALAVPTEVSDPVSVRRMVEQVVGAFGRLDVAVNNAAGGGHRPTPLADVAVGDFDSAVTVSLRGVFLGMKYQIPAMLATGGGAIVNMASTAGLHPVAGLSGYVSSKFGVVGLTKTAALDYAAHGVRVNALAPGPILTERVRAAGEQALRHIADSVPAGQIGTPEQVAAAVVWLCSAASGFVTGAVLPVDGGMLAGMPPWRRSSTG